MARMFAISASRPRRIPRAHDPTAIVDADVVGQYLRHGVPVAGREVRVEAFVHSACRVFQSPCRPAELVEPRERGVEVCLVEDLAAVDQIAVDRQNVDHSPLGVEALLRDPMCHMGDDRSEVVQPMHGLDVDADVSVRSHAGTDVCGQLTGRERVPRRWSMLTQSGVVGGSSCRLSAA